MNATNNTFKIMRGFPVSVIFILCCCFAASKLYADEAQLVIKQHILDIELAITDQEHRQGLMHRKTLAPYHGMLFIYNKPQRLSFWMKDTVIALDLFFFDSDGVLLEIIENLTPCHVNPCESYVNQQLAQFALELPAGAAKKLTLEVGDKFKILKYE